MYKYESKQQKRNYAVHIVNILIKKNSPKRNGITGSLTLIYPYLISIEKVSER